MGSNAIPLPSVDGAIERLQRLRRPGPLEAIEKLAMLTRAADPIALFREMYPKEYEAARRAIERPDRKPSFYEVSPLGMAFQAFAELLDRKHFPMHVDLWMEEYVEYGGPAGIPICNCYAFEWWNGDPAEFETGVRLAMFLLNVYGDVGGADRVQLEIGASFGWEGGVPPVQPVRADALDAVEFRRLFTARRDAGRHLPLAVEAVEHDTGCLWVDVTSEQMVDGFEWTRGDITILTGEFAKAKAIWKRLTALSKWLDADLPGRTAALIATWNCAARRAS